MSLTVLQIAYPHAPVTEDPPGGAEQILSRLDRALVAAGHRSLVIAVEGSTPAGRLIPIPAPAGLIDQAARSAAHAAIRAALTATLETEPIDLIHAHGLDFADYLPPPGAPLLVSLHLPLGWYPEHALRPTRPDTYLLPVSAAQAATAPEGLPLVPPIPNGVDASAFPRIAKRRLAVNLGRIAPEKGTADALAAAESAGWPLLVAGEVFPYPTHQTYFAEKVAPRLSPTRRFLGPVFGANKRRLLARASALLLPTRAPETSSLVAMEALAAGTPVLAYPSGALPSIIEHGRTGFLVDGPADMAAALRDVRRLNPEACREAARTRFPLSTMIERYFALYESLTTKPAALSSPSSSAVSAA